MSMSSRERVLAAINHQQPDRVPVDLGGTRVTSIEPGVYDRLRQNLGLPGDPVRVMDVCLMLAWVEQPVVDALGVDVLPVPRLAQNFGFRLDGWRPWRLDDGTPVQVPVDFDPVPHEDGSLCLYLNGELVGRKPAAGPYFDRMIDYKMNDSLPPVEELSLPLFTDEDLRWRQHWAETLRAETDKALIGGFGSALGRWGSIQEWLYTIAAEPDYVLAFYELKTENLLANMRLYAQAVGDNIDVVWLGEDFGTQQGLMISPKMFKEMVAPYYKRLFDWVHGNTSWKVFFHCCGGIYPIIDTLIDCGVDILNPVQTEAAGMDPVRLKPEFGNRLVFWGGSVEAQSVLPVGSREEIRAQVRERIEIFGPGGGFVFAPTHNIQKDVSPDNVLAAYEAAQEFGQYPL